MEGQGPFFYSIEFTELQISTGQEYEPVIVSMSDSLNYNKVEFGEALPDILPSRQAVVSGPIFVTH